MTPRTLRTSIAVLVLGFCAVAAAAPSKEAPKVEALIRKQLSDGYGSGLAMGAVFVGPRGERADLSEKEGPFLDDPATHVQNKLGKLTVEVDARGTAAWFHGTVAVTDRGVNPGKDKVEKWTRRMSGAAIKERNKWQIVAIMYSNPIADADLPQDKLGSGAPAITGEAALGKLAAEWFTAAGFARDQSASPNIGLIGSADGEYFAGAPAAKMAKLLGGLKLRADAIEAKTWAGAIGWVQADVKLPLRKGGVGRLTLGAVVVPEGGGWKWVSLHFSVQDPPLPEE